MSLTNAACAKMVGDGSVAEASLSTSILSVDPTRRSQVPATVSGDEEPIDAGADVTTDSILRDLGMLVPVGIPLEASRSQEVVGANTWGFDARREMSENLGKLAFGVPVSQLGGAHDRDSTGLARSYYVPHVDMSVSPGVIGAGLLGSARVGFGQGFAGGLMNCSRNMMLLLVCCIKSMLESSNVSNVNTCMSLRR